MQLAPEFFTAKVKNRSHNDRPLTRAARERVAQYITFKVAYPDATRAEIAVKMGIALSTLNGYVQLGHKHGLVTFIDPLERIEFELIPKVIDNLSHYLDEKDKTVTIETAKGTIFKQFQESKGILEAPQTVLAIKIEQPDGSAIKMVSGHIVGRPKKLADHTVADASTYEQ